MTHKCTKLPSSTILACHNRFFQLLLNKYYYSKTYCFNVELVMFVVENMTSLQQVVHKPPCRLGTHFTFPHNIYIENYMFDNKVDVEFVT